MKILNPNTKKAKAFIEAYKVSETTKLHHVYGRYSEAKKFAYEKCKYKCIMNGGYDFRILSANTFQFTCGWRFNDYLRVETRNNSYIIRKAF